MTRNLTRNSATRSLRGKIASLLAALAVGVGLMLAVSAPASADTCTRPDGSPIDCGQCITAVCITVTSPGPTPTTTAMTTPTSSIGGCYDAAGKQVPCIGTCVNGADEAGNICDDKACLDVQGNPVDCSGECIGGYDELQQPCRQDCAEGQTCGTTETTPTTTTRTKDTSTPKTKKTTSKSKTKKTTAESSTDDTTVVTQVSDGSDSLAETGADPAPLVWAAFGLLLLGAAGLYLGRRRRA